MTPHTPYDDVLLAEQKKESPRKTLRVGVVGIGWAGQQHLNSYVRLDGVEVVAIAGMETDLLGELAQTHNVPNAFERWEDMIEAGGLDAISVAVPTFLHAPIAIAALQAGIHVLSEKPIARSGDEAQSMVDAARAANRVLDVAFNHRRRGDMQRLKQAIDAGELGDLYYARGSWLRREGIPGMGGWFTNKNASGGGALIDIGVHALDYSLYFMGEPTAISVSAVSYDKLGSRGRGGSSYSEASKRSGEFEVEDFASALIRFDNGSSLSLEAAWAGYRSVNDTMDFSVFGTDGGAELSVDGDVDKLVIYRDKDGKNSDYHPSSETIEGHWVVVNDFIDSIREGHEAWSRHDGSLALRRARIIDACYESARLNKEVEVVR